MTIFNRPPDPVDLQAIVRRDRYGLASSWTHCNLCPRPDHEVCPQPCSNVRAAVDAEDGIVVTHPMLAS